MNCTELKNNLDELNWTIFLKNKLDWTALHYNMNCTELLWTELFYELHYIRTELHYFLTELHDFLLNCTILELNYINF